MAVSGIHRDTSSQTSPREMYYIKGSIEAILERCKFYYVNDDSTPALDPTTRQVITSKAHAAASRGLRVLAMAYGYGSVSGASDERTPSPEPTGIPGGYGHGYGSSSLMSPVSVGGGGDKTNLVFAGFQAMLDPPRKGVADSIALLQSGGVQVVMITGDSEATAMSIAQKLGMRVGRGPGGGGRTGVSGLRGDQQHGRGEANTNVTSSWCLTGRQIDQMTKVQLKERVGGVSVFARTTPRHKMAIVEAFQARGAVVAMTGDGGRFSSPLRILVGTCC